MRKAALEEKEQLFMFLGQKKRSTGSHSWGSLINRFLKMASCVCVKFLSDNLYKVLNQVANQKHCLDSHSHSYQRENKTYTKLGISIYKCQKHQILKNQGLISETRESSNE